MCDLANQVSAEERSNKCKRKAGETACLRAAEDEATKLCWAVKDKAEAQRREA